MKLIIQVPCFNEADHLPVTFAELPTSIPGIDEIETLVIDDGSTDKTFQVAKELGVNHIIRFKKNRGLAKAFAMGLDESLYRNADIIVNTDADNQYSGFDIEKLVAPILVGEADIVVGDRETNSIKHFSRAKKMFQRLGTRVANILSGLEVGDAVSGFRAYSRESALKLNVLSDFSYTVDTLIQAGHDGLSVISVPIKTNNKNLRDSRLSKNIFEFVKRQIKTMVRSYTAYNAFKICTRISFFMMLIGFLGMIRLAYYHFFNIGGSHVQLLVVSMMLIIVGANIFLIGLIADAVSINRKLLENVMVKIRSHDRNMQDLHSKTVDEVRKLSAGE